MFPLLLRPRFIGYPNTSNVVKNISPRVVFSTHFLVFGYPDETLSVVFDITSLFSYLTLYVTQDKLLPKDSPIALPKSIKNPIEIKGMKNANVSMKLFFLRRITSSIYYWIVSLHFLQLCGTVRFGLHRLLPPYNPTLQYFSVPTK